MWEAPAEPVGDVGQVDEREVPQETDRGSTTPDAILVGHWTCEKENFRFTNQGNFRYWSDRPGRDLVVQGSYQLEEREGQQVLARSYHTGLVWFDEALPLEFSNPNQVVLGSRTFHRLR